MQFIGLNRLKSSLWLMIILFKVSIQLSYYIDIISISITFQYVNIIKVMLIYKHIIIIKSINLICMEWVAFYMYTGSAEGMQQFKYF